MLEILIAGGLTLVDRAWETIGVLQSDSITRRLWAQGSASLTELYPGVVGAYDCFLFLLTWTRCVRCVRSGAYARHYLSYCTDILDDREVMCVCITVLSFKYFSLGYFPVLILNAATLVCLRLRPQVDCLDVNSSYTRKNVDQPKDFLFFSSFLEDWEILTEIWKKCTRSQNRENLAQSGRIVSYDLYWQHADNISSC